ncbi:MAG TPA: hypothetical protein DDZ89_20900 [Clostridiales bacterium]|nr:hypothetical protein [Clostridiales bacterium]
MLLFFIIALVIARIKGYKPFIIFKSYILYPFLVLEIIFWVLQYMMANGNMEVVQFAGMLKTGFFIYLLLPVFYYKLYKSALLGSGLVLLGTLMNKLVMHVNGGKMPVKFTLSKLTGFANETTFDLPNSIHTRMSEYTNLNILGDIFDFGYCVMSIGDIVMKAYFVIVFYKMIEIMNSSVNEKQ